MMANIVETGAKHAVYGVAQAARIGWYSLHYFAGRHLVGPMTKPGEAPYASRSKPADLKKLTQSFRQLFLDEWHYIRDGVYKLPYDMKRLPNLPRILRHGHLYMKDAQIIARRAYTPKGHSEVMNVADADLYPRYYLQNFHHQTDGWLSEHSAKIYDTQVETLFTGSADTMRRQALPFIAAEIRDLEKAGGDHSEITFVDLACGTGRLLSFVKDNFQDLPAIAIDLSPDYLAEAKKRLAPWPGVAFLQGMAEDVPLADNSADILTSVYLYHELPPKIRRQVSAEIARVLKPGGLYVHVETLQYGDEEDFDILLENFPRQFHEPYYDSYCKEDLNLLFEQARLTPEKEKCGFLTKVSTFRKSAF